MEFTALTPTTYTLNTKFLNLGFNEHELIKKFAIPTGPIKKITTESKSLLNVEFKSDKRNKFVKSEFKRQISFWVEVNSYLFKIKVFKNGSIGIPGCSPIKNPFVKQAIILIQAEIQKYIDVPITLAEITISMRNYKFQMITNSVTANIVAMQAKLNSNKEEYNIFSVEKKATKGNIKIQFNNQETNNTGKYAVVIIYPSLKINIKNAKSDEHAEGIYTFLTTFIRDNQAELCKDIILDVKIPDDVYTESSGSDPE